jgi:hypothetical protein
MRFQDKSTLLHYAKSFRSGIGYNEPIYIFGNPAAAILTMVAKRIARLHSLRAGGLHVDSAKRIGHVFMKSST